MSSISSLAPGSEPISEFARQTADAAFANTPNITPGSYHTATCVEDMALMMAMAVAPSRFHFADSQFGDELQAILNAWRAADPAIGPNGASSYVDATRWLRSQGFTVDENLLDTPGFDWWDEMVAGIPHGFVYGIGVTNAQGLPGDETSVHNHGFTGFGLGTNDAGEVAIVCGDGDNWRANEHMPADPVGAFSFYTKQDLINGQISSLTRIHPMPTIPAGWKDDGTTLTAPNGIPVVHGFRDYVLNHLWDPKDEPMGPESQVPFVTISAPWNGPGAQQLFTYSDLIATAALGVVRAGAGQDLAAALAEIATLHANPPAPPVSDDEAAEAAQLAQLTAANTQLQQEVATLQTQLANAHTTLSQEAADAIAVVEALKTALADPTA